MGNILRGGVFLSNVGVHPYEPTIERFIERSLRAASSDFFDASAVMDARGGPLPGGCENIDPRHANTYSPLRDRRDDSKTAVSLDSTALAPLGTLAGGRCMDADRQHGFLPVRRSGPAAS